MLDGRSKWGEIEISSQNPRSETTN